MYVSLFYSRIRFQFRNQLTICLGHREKKNYIKYFVSTQETNVVCFLVFTLFERLLKMPRYFFIVLKNLNLCIYYSEMIVYG